MESLLIFMRSGPRFFEPAQSEQKAIRPFP